MASDGSRDISQGGGLRAEYQMGRNFVGRRSKGLPVAPDRRQPAKDNRGAAGAPPDDGLSHGRTIDVRFGESPPRKTPRAMKLAPRAAIGHRCPAVTEVMDRAYMSRLERELENPTVALLDRLAKALSAHIAEFFIEPKAGESRPKPLPGGRHSQQPVRGKRRS